MRKTEIVFESRPAASNQLPLGSRLKLRGWLPRIGSRSTNVSLPVSGSTAKVVIVSSLRVDA